MNEHKEPRYAPGQELTLHPGDPVKGAELLRDETRERSGSERAGSERMGSDRAGVKADDAPDEPLVPFF
ncbi:MAG TPA: hypothetical protein VGK74_27410 [Symbiobacteriaceae bacterium]